MEPKATNRLEPRSVVIDGHSDIPVDVVKRRRAGETEVLKRLHLPAWKAGGVRAAILTVAGDEFEAELLGTSLWDYSCEAIGHLGRDVQESPDELVLVTSAEELERQVATGRFAIAMNVEGCRSLEGSLSNLDQVYQAGVRFMTLTWNHKNEVGTGAACDPGDGGLTPFGRQAVRWMAEHGMVTDLSHASLATFWDAVGLQTGNLIASHSNAAHVHPHVRNLNDDQIRAIAEQDSYVGVCFYPGFVHSPAPTVEHLLDHIVYIGDLVGIEHVAIGADYIDFALEDIVARIKASGIAYGDDLAYPTEVESIRDLGNLVGCMRQRGLSAQEIARVMGGNLLRVWQRVGRAGHANL